LIKELWILSLFNFDGERTGGRMAVTLLRTWFFRNFLLLILEEPVF
jgi:hypothetical protein